MRHKLVFWGFAAIMCASAYAQNRALVGTYRLISAVRTVVATGERFYPYGKNPSGFITYGPEGRMQAIIASDGRPKPKDQSMDAMPEKEAKELLRSLTAYAGTYSFDGKSVTHHIDTSWNEVWTGTDQIRDVQLDGNRAIYTTRPSPDPRDGRTVSTTLIWEKMK